MKKFKLLAVAAISAFTGSAFAATDAATATIDNSTGDVQVQVQKGELLRITDLNDFTFVGNAPTLTVTDGVCVYSTSGTYFVTSNSSNPNGNIHRMSDGAATPSYITYDVIWNDGNGDVNMDHNTKVGQDGATAAVAFANADTASETCVSTGGTNAQLQINVNNGGGQGFAAAANGTYTDLLTVLISAQ